MKSIGGAVYQTVTAVIAATAAAAVATAANAETAVCATDLVASERQGQPRLLVESCLSSLSPPLPITFIPSGDGKREQSMRVCVDSIS